MTQTVISNASSYLPAAEFLKRVDVRTVADLISDNNTRVGVSGTSTNPDSTVVGANANLIACLNDASGWLESACFAKGRYTSADLSALTGVSQALMYRILTGLTMALLIERRPDKKVPMPMWWDSITDMLQKLYDGEAIFSFSESATAGQVDVNLEQPSDVTNRNLVTNIARPLFGSRRWNAGGSQANGPTSGPQDDGF